MPAPGGSAAIRPYGALDELDEVEAEARAAIAFLGEDRDVRLEPPVQL